jgi:glycosyltransferase involved in cell wall biosynthesis
VTPPRVLALVAAFNEEDSIATTVKSLAGIGEASEIVVIADGSTDRTAEEAAGAGARVLMAPRRMGKGGAIESALDRLEPADVYLLVDGDVGETASEASPLLQEVLSGRLELAVGRLPALEGGGFGMVKAFSRRAIRTITGFDAEEPLSGQRAVIRNALEACRPLAARFGLETAMTIDAVRLGFRVGEVPVDMRHRPTGRTAAGFAHRAGQGLDILQAVIPRALGLR